MNLLRWRRPKPSNEAAEALAIAERERRLAIKRRREGEQVATALREEREVVNGFSALVRGALRDG